MAEQFIDEFLGNDFDIANHSGAIIGGEYYLPHRAYPSIVYWIRNHHLAQRGMAPIGGARIYHDSADEDDEFSITALSYLYRGEVKTMSASLANAMSGGDVAHYIYVDAASATLTVGTSGWPATPHIRVAVITLASGAWTFDSLVDHRHTTVHNVVAAPLAGVREVEAFDASDALTASESGKRCTNAGASGAVTLTLPAATPGLEFHFAIEANEDLIVAAAGSDTIRDAASVSPGGGDISDDTIGNTLSLVCFTAGAWLVTGGRGTWTVSS